MQGFSFSIFRNSGKKRDVSTVDLDIEEGITRNRLGYLSEGTVKYRVGGVHLQQIENYEANSLNHDIKEDVGDKAIILSLIRV